MAYIADNFLLFQGVTTILCHTLFQSSYQKILTLSQNYYQTGANKFSEFISNITETFKQLLPNNTKHFSKHQLKLTFAGSYWQTRVYIKQY